MLFNIFLFRDMYGIVVLSASPKSKFCDSSISRRVAAWWEKKRAALNFLACYLFNVLLQWIAR